jgi:hypothetical protein
MFLRVGIVPKLGTIYFRSVIFATSFYGALKSANAATGGNEPTRIG